MEADELKHCSLEDYPNMDSLYRLVNLAWRRANQISKPESRALIPAESKKPIIIALQEILEGKVGYRTGDGEEDEYEVG